MGDRALVIFVSVNAFGNKGIRVSPTAYLHNYGHDVPNLLTELKELMVTRTNDETYALARFIGIVHMDDPTSNLSLGCFETPAYVKRAVTGIFKGKNTPVKTPKYDYEQKKDVNVSLPPEQTLEEYSHGDAGVVVVDTRDYSWKAYGGYLAETPVTP